MLTKWVGQAWRELHIEKSELIRQTFRKLGLSLAVDGSEDNELSIRDLPGIVVGDWRLKGDQADEQQVEEPEEIDQVTENANSGNKPVDPEYVLDDGRSEVEEDERNSDSELENDDGEDSDDTRDNNTGRETGQRRVDVRPHGHFSKLGFYRPDPP